MANAAIAAAVIAQAIKASGAIVSLEPNDFFTVVSRVEKPAVVLATSGFRKKTYQYLTGYKGFIFYTKTKVPLQLPGSAEAIVARKIWIPS
jgi:hypothetical protein